MKKVTGLKFLLAALIALGLSACGGAKDVEYYKKNPEEAGKKMQECMLANDTSDECKAATQAFGAMLESVIPGLQQQPQQ